VILFAVDSEKSSKRNELSDFMNRNRTLIIYTYLKSNFSANC